MIYNFYLFFCADFELYFDRKSQFRVEKRFGYVWNRNLITDSILISDQNHSLWYLRSYTRTHSYHNTYIIFFRRKSTQLSLVFSFDANNCIICYDRHHNSFWKIYGTSFIKNSIKLGFFGFILGSLFFEVLDLIFIILLPHRQEINEHIWNLWVMKRNYNETNETVDIKSQHIFGAPLIVYLGKMYKIRVRVCYNGEN